MVAKRAEDLGVDCLWVLDRLLWPVNPRAPYPLGDGSLPVQYKNVLDPVETLTFAAAHTSRIALATGVLNLPWYNPVLLARRLTTLDILSRGRLRVGFGIGWSPDEYEAAGATWQDRGKRADESIEMLKKSGRPIRWSFTASIIGFQNRLSVQSPCRNPIHRSIWRHLRLPP
jgi:alkanesulfonate monooxygenase SsuD/methylene tetrahydromethanopterin reductase-like flavin-dependent oxidoreductase (luciferase family)